MSLEHVECTAQQVDHYVVNLAGFDFESSGISVESSIGEVAITTITSGSSTITQGFLQPELKVEIPCRDLALSFRPNPVQNNLYITDEFCGSELGEVEVIDLFGKLVLITEAEEGYVKLGSLANGIYLVRVQSIDKAHTGTFKIMVAQN